jgi:hypothetical protein
MKSGGIVEPMTYWTTVLTILLASFPAAAIAQNCDAMPAGPARTDCYIGLGRLYQGQSDIAAGKARVQSDAARYRQITGTPPAAPARHRPRHPQ